MNWNYSRTFNTYQNISITYELADVLKRGIARIIDIFIIISYTFLFSLVFKVTYNNYFFAIIILLPVFFYDLYSPYFMNGQTFGKYILKIKIIQEDSYPPSFINCFIRWILTPLNLFTTILVSNFFLLNDPILLFMFMYSLPTFLFLLVLGDSFFGLVSNKHQRIADYLINTVVISLKQKTTVDHTILMQITDEYQPVFSNNILQLNDVDIHIIKKTLEKFKKREKDVNTIKRLRKKIENKIQDTREEFSDINYIETVLRDYQYYSEK